jgi:hypothetical protein
MNKLVFKLVPFAAVLGMSGVGQAQTAGPTGATPAAGFVVQAGARAGGAGLLKMADSILEKMTLTADQKTKIVVLEEKLKTSVKALRKEAKASGTTDKTVLKEKSKALTKTFHEDLLAILTPDQQLYFKAEMKAELVKRRKAALAAKGSTTPPPTL